MKVRLQTTQNYTGALDCANKIWKNEGPLAFYKGTLTPLIGIGACVCFNDVYCFFYFRALAVTKDFEKDV